MDWLGHRQDTTRFPLAYLRHVHEPILAAVYFAPHSVTIYQTKFLSEDDQGNLLVTENHLLFVRRHKRPGLIFNFCNVDSLIEQFKSHLNWIPSASNSREKPFDAQALAQKSIYYANTSS